MVAPLVRCWEIQPRSLQRKALAFGRALGRLVRGRPRWRAEGHACVWKRLALPVWPCQCCQNSRSGFGWRCPCCILEMALPMPPAYVRFEACCHANISSARVLKSCCFATFPERTFWQFPRRARQRVDPSGFGAPEGRSRLAPLLHMRKARASRMRTPEATRHGGGQLSAALVRSSHAAFSAKPWPLAEPLGV